MVRVCQVRKCRQLKDWPTYSLAECVDGLSPLVGQVGLEVGRAKTQKLSQLQNTVQQVLAPLQT